MKQDLPVGILRSTTTIDGYNLKLEYTKEHDYAVGSRFEWIARRLTLPLASAMFEALGLSTSDKIRAVVAGVRAEYKRLEFVAFDTPAAKEWAIINGGLNRAEGKRLKLSGRANRKVEQWVSDDATGQVRL